MSVWILFLMFNDLSVPTTTTQTFKNESDCREAQRLVKRDFVKGRVLQFTICQRAKKVGDLHILDSLESVSRSAKGAY